MHSVPKKGCACGVLSALVFVCFAMDDMKTGDHCSSTAVLVGGFGEL
jgi:hypothetical protein